MRLRRVALSAHALRGAAVVVAALLAGLGVQPAGASNSMAVQGDGGVVLAGQLSQLQRSCGPEAFGRDCRLYPRVWPALVRFGPDGTLDSGFGSSGSVIDFRGNALGGSFTAVAVDGDGGILTGSGTDQMVRFTSDGVFDPNFHGARLTPTAILPQPDRSVIVGSYEGIGMKHFHSSLTLSKLGPAGEPAGTVGLVESRSTSTALGLADVVQQGDSLLAAGQMGYFEGVVFRFRLGAGPAADPSFAGGKGILRPGGEGTLWGSVSAIAADGDGFLISAARQEGEPVLARFDGDGILDPSFGEDGIVRLDQAPTDRIPTALIAGRGGAVTVVGQRPAKCPNPRPHQRSPTVSCTRAFLQLIEPGAVMASPVVDLFLPPRGSIDAAPIADGKLLISTSLLAGSASRFAVTRVEADGTIDRSFGEEGVAVAAPC